MLMSARSFCLEIFFISSLLQSALLIHDCPQIFIFFSQLLIGASSLLDDLLLQRGKLATGRYGSLDYISTD